MPINLAGESVLIRCLDERAIGVIHAALNDGATVSVTGTPSTSIQDLINRQLISYISDPDSINYTVVLTPHSSNQYDPPASPVDRGRVTLVGGGPGDPGLLTAAGLEAVRRADVVVYDRLAPLSVLAEASPAAILLDVGKIPRGTYTPQETINQLLIQHAQRGAHVVRLKGGDSFVFGRGGEECQACVDAGIPIDVIPGVSSALAVPQLAGIPVTHRTLSQGVTIVSGHVPPHDPRGTVDWAALAHAGTTIVVLMGVANLARIAETLISAGLGADTPAAVIADGGLPSMRTVRGPVEQIAVDVAAAGLGAPAVIVIGEVAALAVVANSSAVSHG